MAEDIVRVLRIIEIVGPRSWVEETVARSVNGSLNCGHGQYINAATLGAYPEILKGLPHSDPLGEYPEKVC